MATVTKTYRGEYNQATFALTFSSAVTNVNVTGGTFYIDNTVPAVTAKITYSGLAKGTVNFRIEPIINNSSTGDYLYYATGDRVSWTNNASKGVMPISPSVSQKSTSSYFNSSNKTQRTVSLKYGGEIYSLEALTNDGYIDSLYTGAIDVNLSQTITLDAPPTFNETLTYTDDFSGTLVAGFTTANIKLSSLSAKYGGDFSGVGNAEFIIGGQSVSKPNPANNDVLSIPLNSVGTFTPIVKVTDSRGQVTTHRLNDITVIGYNAPTVSFNTSRTTSAGAPDDEGTYGFLEATFTFTDVLVDAVAPSVVMTEDDGTQTTPTVSWYTDNTLTTPVTWSSLSTGATVYGIFSGLSTQHSYTVSVRPRDSEGTGTAVSQTIGAAFYTVDFLAGGHGVAFGKPASRAGFDCDMVPFFNTWIGIVQQFAGSTAPEGWLICDGSAVSRTDYAALFSVIGTTYGTGDGSTTFNLPDMQGRVPIGVSSGHALGTSGGAETVTLDTTMIPAHTHGSRTVSYDFTARRQGANYQSIWAGANVSVTQGSGRATSNGVGTGNQYVDAVALSASHTHDSVGGGGAHNNMQPFLVMNYIIYAGA